MRTVKGAHHPLSARCRAKENTRPLCYPEPNNTYIQMRTHAIVMVCVPLTRSLSTQRAVYSFEVISFSLSLSVRCSLLFSRCVRVHCEDFIAMMNSWVCVCARVLCHSAFIHRRLCECVYQSILTTVQVLVQYALALVCVRIVYAEPFDGELAPPPFYVRRCVLFVLHLCRASQLLFAIQLECSTVSLFRFILLRCSSRALRVRNRIKL